jgi:hypothetical protein
MRYLHERVRRHYDIALFLRCCPQCLGDLELRSDASGRYYTCLQCSARADPPDYLGRLTGLAAGNRASLHGLPHVSR